MSRWCLYLVIVLSVVQVGCQRDAVVTVNEHELSVAELAARADNIMLMFRHRMGEKANEGRLSKIRNSFLAGYDRVWVEDRVLEDYAKKEGIVISDDEMSVWRKRAFANFKSADDRSYADLLKVEGLNVAYWEDQVRSEALRAAVRDHWAAKHPVSVSAGYADEEIAKMEAWNARMALTNAIQYAKATNAWEKLRSGVDFKVVVRECSEIQEEVEDDGDWATVDEKFLADSPALLNWLKKMKVGDFTPPVEADNGLMIARLDEIGDDGSWALSRVFFHLPRFQYPAPKSEIVAARAKELEGQMFAERLKELVSAAHVEFKIKIKQGESEK